MKRCVLHIKDRVSRPRVIRTAWRRTTYSSGRGALWSTRHATLPQEDACVDSPRRRRTLARQSRQTAGSSQHVVTGDACRVSGPPALAFGRRRTSCTAFADGHSGRSSRSATIVRKRNEAGMRKSAVRLRTVTGVVMMLMVITHGSALAQPQTGTGPQFL
jgi:hypothetical protein